MDGSRFDELTRTLANPRSRRAFIRTAGAAIAGALATRMRTADAVACRPIGGICRKGGECCEGVCGPKDAYGRQRCGCSAGLIPHNGSCCADANICGEVCLSAPCANGLTCCASEGACVDIATDPQHCGACDMPIDTDRGEVCCSGNICSAQDICTLLPSETSLSYCQAQPTATNSSSNSNSTSTSTSNSSSCSDSVSISCLT